MTEKEIKETIIKKLHSYKVTQSYSELYDILDDSFKISFRNKIEERNFGLPIIRFKHSNGHWTILGTNAIAYNNNNNRFCEFVKFIELLEIHNYYTLDREKAKLIQPDIKQRRFEYERLEILTHSKKKHLLWINKKWEYEFFQIILHKILVLKNLNLEIKH